MAESFLAAYGTVPYNGRRLQVQPEVGDHPTRPPPAIESCWHIEADFKLCSVPRVGLRDGELQPYAARSGGRIRGDGDHESWVYNRRVVPRGRRQRMTCGGSRTGLSHGAWIRSGHSRPVTIRRSSFRLKVGDVSRVPSGLSARRTQGGLQGRCDEHKGEADRCVTISPGQSYATSWLIRRDSTWRSTRPDHLISVYGELEGTIIISTCRLLFRGYPI